MRDPTHKAVCPQMAARIDCDPRLDCGLDIPLTRADAMYALNQTKIGNAPAPVEVGIRHCQTGAHVSVRAVVLLLTPRRIVKYSRLPRCQSLPIAKRGWLDAQRTSKLLPELPPLKQPLQSSISPPQKRQQTDIERFSSFSSVITSSVFSSGIWPGPLGSPCIKTLAAKAP